MGISAEHGKSVLRKTEKELLGLASGHRADAVHGFRTTTRRLQTLLEQLVADPDGKHKKLLKMLNRIRKAAGKVRDIDVQLEALRSLKTPQEPRRKTQLMQSLIELRAEHEKRLRKLLKRQDIRDIKKRLHRAESSLQLDSGRDPLSIARQMLSRVSIQRGPLDEETLHRYRLVVKRARYAAEFAPKSAETTQFLAELKRLQDALGNWHDWLTLTHTAMERLGDVNQSSLVAVLRNVTRGKFRQAVGAISATKSGPQSITAKAHSVKKTIRKSAAAQRRARAAA